MKCGAYRLLTQQYVQLYVFEDFITEEECNLLIELATPSFERSTGGTETCSGSAYTDLFSGLERSITSYRTSSTTWIDTKEYPLPALIELEQRIAKLTNLPIKNQVCRKYCGIVGTS